MFQALLTVVPGLEERLLESSEEELRFVAELVKSSALDTCSHINTDVLHQDTERCFERKIGRY